MGIILDSSVLVAAEREGQNARAALQAISSKTGNVEIGISVITVMELAHGAARANSSERRTKRLQFIEDVVTTVPVHPVTPSLAWRAGVVDGESQARGRLTGHAREARRAGSLQLPFLRRECRISSPENDRQ